MQQPTVDRREVAVGAAGHGGVLRVPNAPPGLVIFAHGAGSSRLSSRNGFVADRLARRGLASLLLDLLSEDDARDRAHAFDIPLLGARLAAAIRWARSDPALPAMPVGLFGASTGSAAALVASTEEEVAAIVSRGGRPDLAGDALPMVTAPTLLIVGGADTAVIELNREAARHLRCLRRLEIVPGATHLFEEPGALDLVAELAADWFARHFRREQAR